MKWRLFFPDINELWNLWSTHKDYFLINWWDTFSVSLVGALFAILIALIFSILSIRYRYFEKIMTPFVVISQSFPLQAIAPLIILLIGVGFHAKTTIAFTIAFFPIYGNCVSALKTTPRTYLSYLKICRASFISGLIYIKIPAALPTLISAIKIGFTLSVIGAVVAEFIQPDSGLGRIILLAQSNSDIESVYICLIMLMLQGLIIYLALNKLEQYFIKQRNY